jgi:hypothetical protein
MFRALKTWPTSALGLLIVLIPPVALIVAPDGLRESIHQRRWAYAAYFILLSLWGVLGLLLYVSAVGELAREAF